MVRTVLVGGFAVLLSACASVGEGGRSFDRVAELNPASLASDPAAWDGRQVEVTGLVVWEPGHLGLYQSYGAYCRRGTNTAVHVDWPDWPGVSPADHRRMVTVRGTFRNRTGATQPGTAAAVPTAAAGPGPIEPGIVVRWLSEPMKPCPPTR